MFRLSCPQKTSCPKSSARQSRSIAMRVMQAPGTWGVGAALLLAAIPAEVAWSHLSIIRQGLESRGAIESGDQHGTAVAAGDFNGDGFDDVAMGAPYEDVGGSANAGAVIVSWGSEFGITNEGALLLTEGILGFADEPSAEFGRSLVSADFNADGFDDLAVGVPGASGHVGEVYVLRGNASTGLATWYILEQSDAGGGNEADDRFGESLATGNFDGDSNPAHPDLAVGAPGEDTFAGAVFYFMSNPAGPIGPSGWFKQSSFGGNNEPGDMFGFSLAAGNLLGDAADDLAIGVPNKNVGPALDAGLVYVLPAGVGTGLLGSAQTIDASDIDQAANSTHFGTALAAGHFMDPLDWESLAVGEPGRSVVEWNSAGRVVTIPGGGFSMDPAEAVLTFEYNVNGQPADNDRFGSTLAAGFFDTPDTYQDVAIGSPYDSPGGTPLSGAIHVMYGGPAGPSASLYGFAGFNQASLNDPMEGLELLGSSIVFGDFDGTGRGNLAVGAPGEDSQAGMVHIIAPWRQTYGLQCRHSVAYDCDDNLIYSLKPFDPVWVASTTKIMTVLLACERIQAGDFNLETVYDIPNWVVSGVPGSQVALLPGERMSLENLMITCLMRSGNDAAYAIADIIHDQLGPIVGVGQFVDDMNERAAELGMAGTHFHNPAGLDKEVVGVQNGSHISTPVDMAALGNTAMANSLFQEIVSTTNLSIVREGELFDQPWEVNWVGQSFFSWIIDSPWFTAGSGIKGGWTPNAQSTGVFSAGGPVLGTAIAGTFYTGPNAPEGSYGNDAIAVLKLGFEACGAPFDHEYFADHYEFYNTGIRTTLGEHFGGGSQVWGRRFDTAFLELCQTTSEAPTSADVEIRHISEVVLGEGSGAEYGVEPFEAHGEMQIINMGDAQIQFEVETPALPDPVPFVLEPGGVGVIPAYGGPDANGFIMGIVNTGGVLMHLSVEEAYQFDVQFPPGPCVGSSFQARVYRDDKAFGDSFDLFVTGTDPIPGRELEARIMGYDPESSGVESGDSGSGPGQPLGLLATRPAYPNPFKIGTSIGFHLEAEGAVELAVYDATGREVWSVPSKVLKQGNWGIQWDGTDHRGVPVANGAYFYQIKLDGAPAGDGRLVRIR